MSTCADLPDLNVWLALASADHSHHQQAVHYWEQQAAERVLFCTVTALGLVRLAAPEHDGFEVFHQLLCHGDLPARLCTDAYLAALAIANGWRLVSFDRDFERFEGLQWLQPA